jgi:non-ribosomal peptide synthetase component F
VVDHQIKTVKFDLLFNIHDTAQGVRAEVEYNTDLFDPQTIERLVTHYTKLLDILGRAPNSVITGEDLMDKEEKQKVLVEWNDTDQRFEQQHTLHGLFAQQVLRTPEKIAVKATDGQLSYKELYDRAKRIASELIVNGVGKEELVGVVVEKGCQQVASVMGVLFAGAAYLPVDTSWPNQRVEEVFDAGNCRVLLSTSNVSTDCAWKTGRSLIVVDKLTALTQDQMDSVNLPQVAPTDLAYVIFTSGSTGKPKGVVIEHGSAVNTLLDINSKFGVDENDSVLAVSLLSFDLSVYYIFGLLAVGVCDVFPEQEKNSYTKTKIK